MLEISGICGINEKEKVANKKTIGYKGIGFKTVFLNNHYVYLRTGDYSFRFDEGETPEKKVGGKIKRLGAPFQILPIWTKHNEVAKEVNDILDNSSDEFRVQIALRPDNKNLLHIGRNCYENLFRAVFSDSNIILFIPNILCRIISEPCIFQISILLVFSLTERKNVLASAIMRNGL